LLLFYKEEQLLVLQQRRIKMKKKKKKKKKEAAVLHQHRTAKIVFGKAHPVNRKHSKETTQKAHEITIEFDKEKEF
jgi:hypothetical protein